MAKRKTAKKAASRSTAIRFIHDRLREQKGTRLYSDAINRMVKMLNTRQSISLANWLFGKLNRTSRG